MGEWYVVSGSVFGGSVVSGFNKTPKSTRSKAYLQENQKFSQTEQDKSN